MTLFFIGLQFDKFHLKKKKNYSFLKNISHGVYSILVYL